MKPKLYFCEQLDCKVCTETTDRGFKYIETVKGEKYVFDRVDTYTIVFILSGEALVSCNEFNNVLFGEWQVVFFPINSSCAWESLTDTAAIVLLGNNDIPPCDSKRLIDHADLPFNTIEKLNGLRIEPQLKEFLYSLKNDLGDGIISPCIHKIRQWELLIIFRNYYTSKELMRFFSSGKNDERI